MENKTFSKELELRTKRFAISIIRLSASLPQTVEGKVIRNQITRSGTSIGANYREANRSRSKSDFSNKISICESESSETCYWLDIIIDMQWMERSKVEPLLDESNQLLAIFTSVGKKLKL